MKQRFEGRALCDALRITGQHPAYHYCRNTAELREGIEMFRHSSYRFLHVSMHGSINGVDTTLESLTNQEFAEILHGKLKNRRLFFSACEVGSGGLSQLIGAANRGMYSIASPLDSISFGTACAFWLAFYTRVLADNPLGMEMATLRPALSELCAFFRLRMEWHYYNPRPNARRWETVQIG